MDTSLVVGIAALVIAIGFGVWQSRFNRRVEQQLLGSGTTLLEVRWVWQSDQGSVRCQVQAKGIPLSKVTIKTGRVKKSIGALSAADTGTVDFENIPKGERWTVTFKDPKGRPHQESYLIWGNDVQLFG